MRLFRQFILRHLLNERLRSAATILGIALGIAVVIAIQLTNSSSVRGFEAAVETISGKTSLELTGVGLGLDELKLRDLGWLREYGFVSPIIEGDAQARLAENKSESLRILGVDILRDRSIRDYKLQSEAQKELTPTDFLTLLIDPHSIVLTEKFANKYNLQVNSQVTMIFGDKTETFTVRGLLRNEGAARALDGNFALMDIAAAQWAFNRLGRIDRVDIRLRDGVSIDEAETAIKQKLPTGLNVQRPARRGRHVEKMLEAFHFNLTALSYIALIVGLFLIYNTVSISVITRREEIGTLRALGVTRKNVLALFLAEAAALAVIGCAIGLALGRLLSFGAVKLTATTVNSLYIAVAAEPPTLSLKHFLIAFGIGLPLSLLAAALPALEASRVAPTAAMRGNDRLESRFRLRKLYLIAPLLLLTAAWVFGQQNAVRGLPLFGYGAAVAIVAGAAFLVPAVLFAITHIGKRFLARLFKIEGQLANSNLAGAIPRISISVAALAISLSMMVAIAVMIGSFRETVNYWIGQTLQADLYLRPATRSNVTVDAPVSPEVEKLIVQHPAVAAIDRFRNFDLPYEDALITLGSGDFNVILEHGNLQFKEPRNQTEAKAAMRTAIGATAVVVSESFAIKRSKRLGDEIKLNTPNGEAAFRIVGIYYDYSSDRGIVVMDRGTFAKYWGEQLPTSLTIYLRDGVNHEQTRDEILAALGDKYRVLIYTNAAIRKEVLRIFDSTFAITYALEVIAIFVAILGVASTLLTLILERRKEIAMLRLIGADKKQIRKMVVIEAALMGGVSQSIGIVVGLLLSLVLIYVINVQSFGWTIQFHLPVLFLVQSSILILLATALSGIYPAARAARLHATEQVAEE
ncbi:MAG: ABC transporter permease [Acidobacteria bacterium]|nr:ABC transporter permease [Acidobacteriota bacterium]